MANVQSASTDSIEAFAVSEDLVQSPSHKHADTCNVDFEGLLSKPLRLHEDLAEGCGGQLWPAGMVLARYMLQKHRERLEGKIILELGAGGGLVGLAIALGCELQTPLYITDQRPMMALMQRNIKLNDLAAHVLPAVLDWGELIQPDIPTHPDIVLAADCVYYEPAFPLLQATLAQLIGPKTTCYFCFKKRRRADLHFIKAVRKMFDVQEVSDDVNREIYRRDNIFL
ncbi:MAG: hypothetical protein M1812_007747 [Candelaria pacifica]|nr:MAG: hypothetical protein M1812_007747 [Candelaria pacifica]